MEHEVSLEHIHTSELYPKKELKSDDDQLQIPFPLLCGESVEYLGHTEDGVIAMSNFRLFVRLKGCFINVPLRLIESVDSSQMFLLHVYCKDGRTFRCKFLINELCAEWVSRLNRAIQPPEKLQTIFAFAFRAWSKEGLPGQQDSEASYHLGQSVDGRSYSFDREVDRMGFLENKEAWRISYLNENYGVCPTYPRLHIVPKCISDKEMESAANFRTSHRFPSVVWRDRRSGAVMVRCSQPEVGWFSWRSPEDENILHAITKSCSLSQSTQSSPAHQQPQDLPNGVEEAEPNKMLILDARSYTAALANRTKGGGVECPEYYPDCEIQFMNLANIHAIRKSFHAVRALCSTGPEQPNWLSALEATKWLQHISGLMRAAQTAVNAINKEHRPVLVHCSDGWDRTPQITALAQLMLDPYYRTIEGFQWLVEREWLEFGHKFGDRCGHGVKSDDLNERCPVFLQWLDCVYQLIKQFPCAFEFGEAFLMKLSQHVYSCLFGTFLCNSVMERERECVQEQTCSVWALLKPDRNQYRNFLYSEGTYQVLRPSFQLKQLSLWSAVYLADSTQTSESMNNADSAPCEQPSVEPAEQPLVKTRSCDDIKGAVESCATNTRRLSDPSLTTEVTEILKSSLQDQTNMEDPSGRLQIGVDIVKFENKPSEETVACDDDGCSERTDEENCKDSVCEVIMNGHASADTDDATVCELTHQSSAVITNSSAAETDKSESDASEISGLLKTCTVSAENINDTDSTITDKSVASVESSTDTLMGELAIEQGVLKVQSATKSLHRGLEMGNIPVNTPDLGTIMNTSSDGTLHPDEFCLNRGLATLSKMSSIGTSTTDISDSRVHANGEKHPAVNGNALLDTNLFLHIADAVPLPQGLRNGTQSENLVFDHHIRGCSHDSIESSSTDTPYNSRTPSSTNPPTPGADGKVSNPWLHRGINRHLDCDGLTLFRDSAQHKLCRLILSYQAQQEEYRRQLHLARLALYHYAASQNGAGKFHNDGKEEVASNPESTGSGEINSLGANSTTPSDVSWEQMEGDDARMTLWVPDHAVTHCGGCDIPFGLFMNRRHHCRNCGHIFCGDCANKFIPVPAQQLLKPVRVCTSCFSRLNGGISSLLLNGHTDEAQPDQCKPQPRIIAPAAN